MSDCKYPMMTRNSLHRKWHDMVVVVEIFFV
jgi:RNA polymerase subunit RPABC4/transcription elongation factor Spt4